MVLRKASVRAVIVMLAVTSLAMPAEAKPREGGRRLEKRLDPIVKMIKKFVVKSLGDGLVDPRP